MEWFPREHLFLRKKVPDSFLSVKLSWPLRWNAEYTLPDTDSGTDPNSDSNLVGYVVLCRTCSHWILGSLSRLPNCHCTDIIPGLESESSSGNVNKPLILWQVLTFSDLKWRWPHNIVAAKKRGSTLSGVEKENCSTCIGRILWLQHKKYPGTVSDFEAEFKTHK